MFIMTNGQATLGSVAVALFFIVSGLLVSQSFDRSHSVPTFVKKRAARILPALLVSCLITIFIVGPLFTQAPLNQYLISKETWSYLANAVFLPSNDNLLGVFAGNKLTAVNGSLWTLRFEVVCYAICAVVLYTRQMLVLIVTAMWILSLALSRVAVTGEGVWFYVFTGAHLFRFFGAGMLLYLLRRRIRVTKNFALISLVITVLAVFTPFFNEVLAMTGAYALISFCFLAPKWFCDVTKHGDISYGVYIYAWPLQQMLAPFGYDKPYGWLLNIALTLPLTLAAGLASWLYVERPMIKKMSSSDMRRTVAATAT